MFGYIKPFVPELRVAEHELYRATYCGLCRAMGRNTGCASCLSLSYDFVFLSAVRMTAEGIAPTVSGHRCLVHPLKKRKMLDGNPSLRYCSAAAASLLCDKLADDIGDERGIRRLGAKLILPTARRAARRGVRAVGSVYGTRGALARLGEIENKRLASLDAGADCFGELLGGVFAEGLDGENAAICREIGRETGRYIYALDAACDISDDASKGRYNPIYELWGEESYDREGKRISRSAAGSVYNALLVSLERLGAAVELLDFHRAPHYEGIIKNTVYIGMPEEARRHLGPNIE